MEVPGGNKRKFTVCAFELIGTAFLVLTVNWTQGRAEIAGAMLFVLLVCFGSITGGHFNPAVTVGVMINCMAQGDVGGNAVFAAMIMISQIIGGMIGASFARINDQVFYLKPFYGCRDPLNVMFVELITTFTFIFLIMIVKFQNTASDFLINVLTVGAALATCASFNFYSGGGLNPSVTFATQLFSKENPPYEEFPNYTFYWIAAELVAGALAGIISLIVGKVKKSIE